jgi:hypothetical protein
MLELDRVHRAPFAEFVGQDFEIALKDAPLNVRLVEVRSLGAAQAGNREPFALEFRAEASVGSRCNEDQRTSQHSTFLMFVLHNLSPNHSGCE